MPKAEGGGGRNSGGGRQGRERFQPGGGGGPLTPEQAEAKMEQLGVGVVQRAMLRADGSLQKVAEMMPPGTTALGKPGAEAFAVRLPDGTVLRVQPMIAVERANIGIMAQPISVTKFGNTTVEKLHYIQPANTMSSAMQQEGKLHINANMPKGYEFSDPHAGNYGKDATGQWKVLDPGAVTPERMSPGRVTFRGAAERNAFREAHGLQNEAL